ncbi:zinc-binding alcohol dehydrogenase [candidate division WOR-3 bacterium]|nr:zinc-binding alcohol dehydrogenase [candidate division WOR-3 bacterium]
MLKEKLHGERVVFLSPRKLELEGFSISLSEVGEKEVLLKTKWTLISPGTEVAIYSGDNKRAHQEGSWCQYPFRPGYANIGEVIECGKEVKAMRRGDYVYCHKPHASHAILDEEKDIFVILKENQKDPHSLFTRMAEVSQTAVVVTDKKPGSRVVIFGLGLVGNLSAQLFQIAGYKVIGIELSKERAELAKRCGIENVLNQKGINLNKSIREFTNGEEADVVVDAVGVPDICCDGIKLLKPYGELILLGTPKPEMTKSGLEFLLDIHIKFITVKSGLEWIIPRKKNPYSISKEDNISYIMDLIDSGKLNVKELCTHKIKYEKAKEAYEDLLNEKNNFFGVILEW